MGGKFKVDNILKYLTSTTRVKQRHTTHNTGSKNKCSDDMSTILSSNQNLDGLGGIGWTAVMS